MIGYFARHPTAANLLMLVLVLLGALGLPRIQRETYPVFETDTLTVSASFPGADAQVMDQDVVETVTRKWAQYGLPGSGRPIWR